MQSRTRSSRAFLVKTYLHTLGGLGVFAIFQTIFQTLGVGQLLINLINSVNFFSFIYFMVFVAITSYANNQARRSTKPSTQYAAFAGYLAVEAFFFSPLIFIAIQAGVLPIAIVATFALFAILTLTVLITGQDFSFLRSYLRFYISFCSLTSFIYLSCSGQ